MSAPAPALRRSVRTQLIVWNALALALLLGGLGLIIRYTVRNTLMTQVDRQLAHRPPPPRQGPPATNPDQDGLAPPPAPPRDPFRPRPFDLQGRPLSGDADETAWDPRALASAARGKAVYSTVTLNRETLRVFTHPFRDAGLTGVMQTAMPLDEIERALTGLDRALLGLIPVGLFCAGLAGAGLTGRVLRPVRRMTQAAAQIGAQDLSARLPVAGRDEFGELADTFNALLGRLDGAFREQKHLVEQLQSLIQQQRRFTADASHELKTPLTIIKANTSLALSGSPSPEDVRQSLDDIDLAAGAMSKLVQDLLLLASADEGQLGRDRVALPVREILEQARSQVRRPGGAPITLDAPADAALSVCGNQDELIRLFSNLLENAVRYTPPAGRVGVTTDRDGPHVRVFVSDTGTGVPPEHLSHLGERFYRADAARTRQDGGTGLGLAICRSILEAHGGSMTFQSRVGQGTVVCVTLLVAEPCHSAARTSGDG